uniref:Endonuclease/exonuclease/phosphatase domain-containing protein n=1 Tax=Gouania willdenowi TaxID=441366 RepID=A0A8C5HNE1_GOUWI
MKEGTSGKVPKFSVTSWNVRGINIFDYVSRLNADIVFFQETHLLKSEKKSLTDSNFNKIQYIICFNSRQRGVSVLFNKRLLFNILNCTELIEKRDLRNITEILSVLKG